MLVAYTGTCGSGKTYHAVHDIWNRVAYGHPVITNIPLNIPHKRTPRQGNFADDNVTFLETFEITPAFLESYSNDLKEKRGWSRVPEDYIYLVIDEAQLIFNCREWNAKNRGEWVRFFQLHRKLGYHVILITQMSKMLDNQMRGILEYEYLHRKASNFGLKGKFLSLVLLSPTLFISVRMWSCLRERIDSSVCRYSRRIAKMYDTTRLY